MFFENKGDFDKGAKKMWFRSKVLITAGVAVVTSVVGFVIFWCMFVNFIENYEYGFKYDKFSGEIITLKHGGWVVAAPWRYSVHSIDTRPYQVSISANERVLNAKLIRFKVDGLKTFVEWHGRSAGDSVYNLREILKCYAFDRDEGRDCPFLEVLSVLAPNQTPQTQAASN